MFFLLLKCTNRLKEATTIAKTANALNGEEMTRGKLILEVVDVEVSNTCLEVVVVE